MQTDQPQAVSGQQLAGGRQVAAPPKGESEVVADTSKPKLRLSFSLNELARLSGMSYWTLRYWSRNRWIRRSGDGFSAWTVVAVTILGCANRGRGTGSYIGDIAACRAMEVVADLDDALLVSESVMQDPYVAEAAAAIASAALPSEELELSDELVEKLARVVSAVDRKARERHWRGRRLR